jgi:hypothetical protein
MNWEECKTVDDLWEAARLQHLVFCITRSLDCNTEKCKTCAWDSFNEERWGETIKEERIKRGI